MSTFSVGGLGTGIDYTTMIEQIIKLERRPLQLKASRQQGFQTKISRFGELSSLLDKLKTASNGLNTSANFYTRQATASNRDVVNVSASSSAVQGNYSVVVNQLAQAHRIASSSIADANAPVAGASGNFSFTVGGGEEISVAVNENTTLNQLAAAINAATDQADASVINDGTGFRLVLKSTATGAGNAITVTQNDTSIGLPTGGVSGGQVLQVAQDAVFSIDGLTMTRSTNNIDGAIRGVSLTLKSVGTSNISIANDTGSIQEKIQSFVDAYNEVARFVSANTSFNSQTGVAGAFLGESTAREVVGRLQMIFGGRVEGLPDNLSSLAHIGISTQRDGTLKLDTAVLSERLESDLSGVARIFTSENGVAASVSRQVDLAINSSTGSITFRTKGLQSIVSRITNEIERGEANLKKREENLLGQFSRLEALMTQFQSNASALSGIIGALNNNR